MEQFMPGPKYKGKQIKSVKSINQFKSVILTKNEIKVETKEGKGQGL